MRCSDLKEICDSLNKDLIRYSERYNVHYFTSPIPKDSLIKKAVKQLNNTYKKIDKGYKVILDRESNKYKKHRWRYGRKIGYWVVSSFNYRVCLSHEKSDWYIKTIDIINLVNGMNDTESIYNYFNAEMTEHKIKLECVDCGNCYEFTSKEFSFYKTKGFDMPKRCKCCRDARKKGVI